jgi:hypothetical protein
MKKTIAGPAKAGFHVLALAAAAVMSLPVAAQNVGWDAKFRAIPNANNIGDYIKRMSARPHHLGSPYDKDNAEWILSKFKEWGWDARIETYDVLFPTPNERLVEMVGPSAFTLKLEEPAVAEDPTSAQKNEQLPSFNAYSIDGDVTGPILYGRMTSGNATVRSRRAYSVLSTIQNDRCRRQRWNGCRRL